MKRPNSIPIGILIPAITGLIYFIGLLYYERFLYTFGLDESQFPTSVDKTLYYGFIAFLTEGTKGSFYLVIYSVIIYVIADIAINSKFLIPLLWKKITSNRPRKALDEQESREKQSCTATERKNPFVEFCFNMAAGSLLLTVFLFGLLSSGHLAQRKGEEAAKALIEKMRSEKAYESVVTFRDHRTLVSASLIVCNPSSCAYWSDEKTKILSSSDILEVTSTPRTTRDPL